MLTSTDRFVSACARLGESVRGLRGWRRLGFAILVGAITALGFAPFGIFPLLLLGYAAVVLLLDGTQRESRPIWESAGIGWAFGFGQFLTGLYWVAYAFLVDPLQHAWQIPFVAILFPGGLALLPAFACAASAALWREGVLRVFVLAAMLSIFEWLRGHILTGFPWNLAGYGWGASLSILQSTAVFGVYGLTLLTFLFGASLALPFEEWSPRALALPLGFAALFVVFWIGGAIRLTTTPELTVPGVRLRIVQPNVPQDQKYIPSLRAAHWRELIELSLRPARQAPTHIIWPEAAVPFLLQREPVALADIIALTSNGKTLMTGAIRAVTSLDRKTTYRNSFYMFGPGRQVLAIYDKFHLVPFGEYVPFPATLHALGIDKLVNQPGSFASGDGPHTYSVPGAPPVGPLICYEILFPHEVVGQKRPGWFVNVTDDSWFGPASSTGPYQHLLVARVRAIEEGIPVARAANTGISAVIDPLGRVLAMLPLERRGVVDAPLPRAANPTPYERVGDWGFLVMLLICLALGLFRPRSATS
ncbi:MAG TPA: apolipoprotein N-acyltransferase [Rhizomicrobium sp.]|nr:apolipoprotein N-acyltransferase [Rhizomicrobium sp.]